MDVDPSKRLLLCELPKYTEDKWLKKVSNAKGGVGGNAPDDDDERVSLDALKETIGMTDISDEELIRMIQEMQAEEQRKRK